MKKWFVGIVIYASCNIEVEADTEQEAIDKAFEKGIPTLCHQCSEEIELGEYCEDGHFAEEL